MARQDQNNKISRAAFESLDQETKIAAVGGSAVSDGKVIPEFEQALRLAPKSDVLRHFAISHIDPQVESAALYIANDFNTFYSVSDWKEALTDFAQHLEKQMQAHISTGHSEQAFSGSWISSYIDTLYPLKWRQQPIGARELCWRRMAEVAGKQFEAPCSYDEADTFEWLSTIQIEFLSNPDLRKRIFETKSVVVKVLRSLLLSVESAQPIDQRRLERTIEEVAVAVRERLDKAELEQLKNIDLKYHDKMCVTLPNYPLAPGYPCPGGIGDLMTMTSLVLCEATNRYYPELRAALSRWEAEPPRVGVDGRDFLLTWYECQPDSNTSHSWTLLLQQIGKAKSLAEVTQSELCEKLHSRLRSINVATVATIVDSTTSREAPERVSSSRR
ncbi:MAG: hypothetical protein IPH75_05340 [bacterium]|nr:hypothetical protein [bacterium]